MYQESNGISFKRSINTISKIYIILSHTNSKQWSRKSGNSGHIFWADVEDTNLEKHIENTIIWAYIIESAIENLNDEN